MHRAAAFALLAAALGAAPAPAGAQAADTTSPDIAYVRAVDAMRALVSPPYATYASNWESTGLGFEFEQDRDRIVIAVGLGGGLARERHFDASYRSADRALQFTDDAGDRFVGNGHLLEPTWAGAYDILRYGLHGNEPEAVATATPSGAPATSAPDLEPAPSATPSDAAVAMQTPPPAIGSVTAISPRYYRVFDNGTGTCPGLGNGRALHLVARHDVQAHPLTDVVLDPSTGRFCSMTFVLKESGLAGITGHYTIDFAPFGSYWLISDGLIDINVRLFGISAKRATLHWAISGVATPDSIPDAIFVPPTPEPTEPPHGKHPKPEPSPT
jgi:hypothetical protein